MLDSYVARLVEIIEPYVTDTIWIGLLNKFHQRVKFDRELTAHEKHLVAIVIKDTETDFIRHIFEELLIYPKIRWKDSIRKLLNLPEYDGVG